MGLQLNDVMLDKGFYVVMLTQCLFQDWLLSWLKNMPILTEMRPITRFLLQLALEELEVKLLDRDVMREYRVK